MEFLADSVGLLDYDDTSKPIIKRDHRVLDRSDTSETYDDEDDDCVLSKQVQEKVCPNGAIFTGRVDALTGELLHGYCLYVKQQEAYEGPFNKEGQRHGPGAVCTKLDGSGKFLGSYQNDSFHHGTYVTSEWTYTGYFSNASEFDGQGTLGHVDGTVYEGEFHNGLYHGRGRLVEASGRTYEGHFENGMKQGIGELRYAIGAGGGQQRSYCYRGEWKQDRKHGNGVESNESDKTFYEGDFQHDLRHGIGTLKVVGVELTGSWLNGRPVEGAGWKIVYPKRNISYVGEMMDWRPHGQGTMVVRSSNGDTVVYEGAFCCGLRHGLGKISSEQEGDYDGEWRGDEPLANLTESSSRPSLAGIPKAKSTEELLAIVEPDANNDSSQNSSSVPELLELLESSCSDLTQNLDQSQSLASSASFHSAESTYLDYKDAKSVGDDEWVYNNGDTFTGHIDTFQNRHGYGIFTHQSTGAVFSGEWNMSRRHGAGHQTNPLTGIHYAGEYVANIACGKGKLTLTDGSTYKGDFVDGIMHGSGQFVDAITGSVYVGDFKKGVKHGQGEETWRDSTMYKGDFFNGKRCGEGRLFHVEGDTKSLVYKGEWKESVISGQGERFDLTEPCKGSYKGAFVNSKREGHGSFTTDDGRVYEGPWANDKPEDGDWVISCPRDGSVFYGAATCQSDKNDGLPLPNGFGTHKDVNGDFYTGSFANGERNGSGLCVFSGGEQWDGRWERGIFKRYNRARPCQISVANKVA